MISARHLPGQDDPHLKRLARNKACIDMANELLQEMDFTTLCDVVEAAIEARPDADRVRLTALAQTLDLRAWKMLDPHGE